MSTPVCLANAVCDALELKEIDLPLTPKKISAIMHGEEQPRPAKKEVPVAAPVSGNALTGTGSHSVPATPAVVWDTLIDPDKLASVIPGCHELKLVGDNEYEAEVTLGVGPVSGKFKAKVKLSEMDEPNSVVLSGGLDGPLGSSRGTGNVKLAVVGAGTEITYDYAVEISGKVAAIGGRVLEGSTRMVINQFFKRLTAKIGGEDVQPSGGDGQSFWQWLLSLLGVGK